MFLKPCWNHSLSAQRDVGLNEVNPTEGEEDLKEVSTTKPRENLILLVIRACLTF